LEAPTSSVAVVSVAFFSSVDLASEALAPDAEELPEVFASIAFSCLTLTILFLFFCLSSGDTFTMSAPEI
ncbi:hypothetical protein A2U01_0072862, partial [Trifolium medium]|nr:hypothetical protein [Trifolium medium]